MNDPTFKHLSEDCQEYYFDFEAYWQRIYALLKVDEEEYSKLDRQYILRTKKESYGYSCLTNQKQYYVENYPQMAIEKGNIDEVITMMIRGVE